MTASEQSRPARSSGPDTTDPEYLREVTIGEPQVLTERIVVADYDPQWPKIFERLATDIRGVLGDTVVSLEHIGSTSVPGLAAKPIIDIQLVVADPDREAGYVPALETLGYLLRIREPQWHRHRVLKHTEPATNLHVFGPGAEPVHRDLMFRDRLRDHDTDRDHYARVKRELAQRDWTYMQQYADAKTEVVTEILHRAGYREP